MKNLLLILILFPSLLMAQGVTMENIANSIQFKEQPDKVELHIKNTRDKVFENWLSDGVTYVLVPFISGVGNGVHEVLIWRWDNVKAKYPNINEQYWNPLISWPNKHKNGDPSQGPAYFGSRDILIWTTDGYHLSGAVRTAGMFTFTGLVSLDLINNSPTLKQFAIKFGIGVASFIIGNHLGFNEIMQ